MTATINLLVIEDNPDDFLLLSEALESSERIKVELSHCTRLAKAVEYAETEEIDVAILDLDLPDSCGLETYLSFSRKFPQIPVVVITGYKDNELAIQAMQKGAQDYIFKGETSAREIERALLYSIERHRLITELKASTETIRTLSVAVEQSPVSIVITDADGKIEYVNKKFCQITGYPQSEVIGENPRILKSGKISQETFEQLWTTILSNKEWHGEFCNKKRSGELYWESAFISPVVDDEGRTTNFIAVKEDITDRKALEQLKEEIDHIMRHDLKGPLTGIISLPELLELKGSMNEEQRRIIGLIQDAGHSMLNMINLSLDIIKMENKAYIYRPSQIDLTPVLLGLLEENHVRLSDKNLPCKLRLNGDKLTGTPELKIWSELPLISRLLSNLLVNAIEASPENETILIDIHREGGLSIAIQNKGAVPEQVRSDFFGKYKTYGKKRGTGLGTYSAKMMADAMQYTIRMETSDDQDLTRLCIGIPEHPPEHHFNWLI